MTQNKDAVALALDTARKALEHDVPENCWATGPMTGDFIQDLVACPGCSAINLIDAALSSIKDQQAHGAIQKPVARVKSLNSIDFTGVVEWLPATNGVPRTGFNVGLYLYASPQPAPSTTPATVGIQACRQGDRDMLATDAGAELLQAAAKAMQSPASVSKPEVVAYNPWKKSLANCIEGSNYLRSKEYQDLIDELDRLYSIEELTRCDAPRPVYTQDAQQADKSQDQGRDDVIERLECKHCGSDLHIGHKFDCKLKEPSNGN